MKKLSQILISKNLTITSVESFTGGLFANEITNISGASKCYKGSIICYSNEVKINTLNIEQNIIKKYGVVSKQVSELMAINGLELLKSDICVSFTGNAPVNNKQLVDNRLFFSIKYKEDIYTYEYSFKTNNRKKYKKMALNAMLEKIFKII